jgi:hypothetical protein
MFRRLLLLRSSVGVLVSVLAAGVYSAAQAQTSQAPEKAAPPKAPPRRLDDLAAIAHNLQLPGKNRIS